jgi:hypothetical protein
MANKQLLTMDFIRAVKPTHRNEEYPDTQQRCFRLYVSKNGAKSYAYRQNKKGGFRTIAPITEKSLAEARKICASWVDAFNSGRDPFKEIDAGKAAVMAAQAPKLTVQTAFDEYARKVLPEFSEKHRRNVIRSMTKHVLPVFGDRVPKDIVRREWLAFREKHEDKPSEMRQMSTYMTTLFKWMRDQSAYESLVEHLPDFGTIKRKAQPRTRKLTNPEHARAIYQAFKEVPLRAGGLAAEFKWLSNKRGIEVQRMTIDQVDLSAKRWQLPWVKNKAENIGQPLTDRMVEIIKAAMGNRTYGYVFSTTGGDKPITLGTKLNGQIIELAQVPHISWHDYRRTFDYFATLDGERWDVLEACKGHKVYKNVAASYGDERALHGFMLQRYEKWQRFCEGES